MSLFFVFFFFQAEDGIRCGHVTGVQTCALPISHPQRNDLPRRSVDRRPGGADGGEIGRASCRERVSISVVAVSLKKKNEKSINLNEMKKTTVTSINRQIINI